MVNVKAYLTADDIAKELGISKGKAYEIIRVLNADLKSKGYITISGRVPRKYFSEKYYGYALSE